MVWGCYPDQYKALLANYYLTWELIQSLAESKITTLDFGRSPKEGGSHAYKSNWGPEEIPIFTDYLAVDPQAIPDLKPENKKYARAIATWKKLPLAVTKIVGPRLARYFP
jgi:hypothetical protein